MNNILNIIKCLSTQMISVHYEMIFFIISLKYFELFRIYWKFQIFMNISQNHKTLLIPEEMAYVTTVQSH